MYRVRKLLQRHDELAARGVFGVILAELILFTDQVGGKAAHIRIRMGQEITVRHEPFRLATVGRFIHHTFEKRRIEGDLSMGQTLAW